MIIEGIIRELQKEGKVVNKQRKNIFRKTNKKAYHSNSSNPIKNILERKNYLGGYKNEYR